MCEQEGEGTRRRGYGREGGFRRGWIGGGVGLGLGRRGWEGWREGGFRQGWTGRGVGLGLGRRVEHCC